MGKLNTPSSKVRFSDEPESTEILLQKPSGRIDELALPIRRKDRNDRSLPIKIKRSTLRYQISDRISRLAVHVEKQQPPNVYRTVPFKIPRSALTAIASERVRSLAEPRFKREINNQVKEKSYNKNMREVVSLSSTRTPGSSRIPVPIPGQKFSNKSMQYFNNNGMGNYFLPSQKGRFFHTGNNRNLLARSRAKQSSNRISELAIPRKRYDQGDRSLPIKVRSAALTYEISDRLSKLAVHVEKPPGHELRKLPIKIPRGVLTATASARIRELAEPKASKSDY